MKSYQKFAEWNLTFNIYWLGRQKEMFIIQLSFAFVTFALIIRRQNWNYGFLSGLCDCANESLFL
jgi:hypothetical protein